jgi:hypothetical protein
LIGLSTPDSTPFPRFSPDRWLRALLMRAVGAAPLRLAPGDGTVLHEPGPPAVATVLWNRPRAGRTPTPSDTPCAPRANRCLRVPGHARARGPGQLPGPGPGARRGEPPDPLCPDALPVEGGLRVGVHGFVACLIERGAIPRSLASFRGHAYLLYEGPLRRVFGASATGTADSVGRRASPPCSPGPCSLGPGSPAA